MSFAQMKGSIVLMEDESGSFELLLHPDWDCFVGKCALYMSFIYLSFFSFLGSILVCIPIFACLLVNKSDTRLGDISIFVP